MKSKIKNFTFRVFFVLGLLVIPGMFFNVAADMAAPQPPAENPHPPQTPEDIRRVKFAEQVVKLLLFKPLKPVPKVPSPLDEHRLEPSYQNKSLDCLKKTVCLETDPLFVQQILAIQQKDGLISEIRHAHLIPWAFEQWKNGHSGSRDKQPPEKKSTTIGPTFIPNPNPLKLQNDEYVVHLYAKINQSWFHVDVVLSEDAKGVIFLRRFDVFPITYGKMPPGKLCFNVEQRNSIS